jgi:hypothetical protein
MKLAETAVAFPVLSIRAQVEHASPRRPTAFERVILRMCATLDKHDEYSTWSVLRIFEDILMVPNAELLVRPPIEELIGIDVLASDCEMYDFKKVCLGDLRLTSQGQTMVERGVLPSRSRTDEAQFFYDPIANEFISRDEFEKCSGRPLADVVDAQPFEQLIPLAAIRDKIETFNFPWLRPNCVISRVERLATDIAWRNVPGRIELRDGQVKFTSGHSCYDGYVDNLEQQLVLSSVLTACPAEAPKTRRDYELALDALMRSDFAELPWLVPAEASARAAKSGTVCLLNATANPDCIPDEAPAGRAIAIFREKDGDVPVSVSWNRKHNGCLIAIPRAFPLHKTFAASDAELFAPQEFTVETNIGWWRTLLVQRIPMTTPRGDIRKALVDVAMALQDADVPDGALVPAIWETPEVFWRRTAAAKLTGTQSIECALDSMSELRSKLAKWNYAGHADGWDVGVTHALRAHLSGDLQIDIDAMERLCSKISSMQPANAARAEEVLRLSLGCLVPVTSIQEYANVARRVMKLYNARRFSYSQSLYSDHVLRAAVDGFDRMETVELFESDNDLDAALRELHACHGRITSEDGGENDTILVEAWLAAYNELCHKCPFVRRFLPGSRVECESRRLAELSDRAAFGAIGLRPNQRRLFVVDPAAIVAAPDILDSLESDGVLVVPLDIQERLSGTGAVSAVLASDPAAALRRLDSKRVRYCDAAVSVDTGGAGGDGALLAIASRIKGFAILVSDRAELNKSAAVAGVWSISCREFRGRQGPVNDNSRGGAIDEGGTRASHGAGHTRRNNKYKRRPGK